MEKAELTAAKRRITELGIELAIHRRASELLGKVVPQEAVRGDRGDGRRRATGAAGTRGLAVSESGYYDYRGHGPSAREQRHALLTDVIREIHAASCGTDRARRMHAELTLGRGWWCRTARSSC